MVPLSFKRPLLKLKILYSPHGVSVWNFITYNIEALISRWGHGCLQRISQTRKNFYEKMETFFISFGSVSVWLKYQCDADFKTRLLPFFTSKEHVESRYAYCSCSTFYCRWQGDQPLLCGPCQSQAGIRFALREPVAYPSWQNYRKWDTRQSSFLSSEPFKYSHWASLYPEKN